MKLNKISLLTISSLFIISSLSSCKVPTKYDSYDYTPYYELHNSFKGVELYCWTNDEEDIECGMLDGTNRLKTVEEVYYMQQTLPCPLYIMKKILEEYTEEEKESVFLFHVSYPPLEEELKHLPNEDDEFLTYVSSQLFA